QGDGKIGGGAYAFRQSLLSGRKAMNNLQTTYFEVGHALDAVIYDADYPLFATSSLENLIDTIVYCGDASSNLGTLVDGKWMVKNGKHVNQSKLRTDFKETMKALDVR
ncbi:MAG: formimidoylglutamate deiminase, partial [Cyclobacteriaceae bacterium]|nr:formimidoylglutamate deiminase [Cyclobacteriaceae bacterium]